MDQTRQTVVKNRKEEQIGEKHLGEKFDKALWRNTGWREMIQRGLNSFKPDGGARSWCFINTCLNQLRVGEWHQLQRQ